MEIKVFEHKDFGKVRTMLVDGQPYFVGKCGGHPEVPKR